MDIFSFLSYINKVSLLAFFITTLVVGYQIYALRKDKTKEKAPSIPDFKDMTKVNGVINYTSLPSSLIKKNDQPPNYSKLIFLIISLLTIIVVIFVLVLIRRSSTTKNNEVLVTPTIVAFKKPTLVPTIKIIPTVVPTLTLSLSMPPINSTSPTLTPTVVPTEIILAQEPTGTDIPEATSIQIETLPETGSFEKGFLIFGVALATIVFSFVF